jgi:hypothetical protein
MCLYYSLLVGGYTRYVQLMSSILRLEVEIHLPDVNLQDCYLKVCTFNTHVSSEFCLIIFRSSVKKTAEIKSELID